MGRKFSYRIYGLNILSDIECPEVVHLQDENITYDVVIELGKINEEIHELIAKGQRSNYTNDQMWFHISDVATYLIQQGETVTIELAENASLSMVKQYLLGSCLGMIMLQRNMIAIHGGTILFDGNGIIFTGDRGAGKSTITSALRLKGYSFVADDVSSVEVGQPHMIHPGFPQQKLCRDAAETLGYELDQYKTLMSDTQMKYLIPASESFVNHQVPLQAIVELQESDEVNGIEVSVLSGQERLMTIYKNIYRIEMKQCAGVNPEYFKKCVTLTKDIPVYRLKRQKGVMTVEQQIAWLEETFLKPIKKMEA